MSLCFILKFCGSAVMFAKLARGRSSVTLVALFYFGIFIIFDTDTSERQHSNILIFRGSAL